MKKVWIFFIVYSIFLCVPIEAKEDRIQYKLYLDSKVENTKEVKEYVFSVLDDLTYGLDQESYATMFIHNLSYLEETLDAKVKLQHGKLIVKMGDAKGSMLKGKYTQKELCLAKVKPKSKLKEWLGK